MVPCLVLSAFFWWECTQSCGATVASLDFKMQTTYWRKLSGHYAWRNLGSWYCDSALLSRIIYTLILRCEGKELSWVSRDYFDFYYSTWIFSLRNRVLYIPESCLVIARVRYWDLKRTSGFTVHRTSVLNFLFACLFLFLFFLSDDGDRLHFSCFPTQRPDIVLHPMAHKYARVRARRKIVVRIKLLMGLEYGTSTS